MIEGREEFRSPGSLLPGGLLYGSSGTQDAFHPVTTAITSVRALMEGTDVSSETSCHMFTSLSATVWFWLSMTADSRRLVRGLFRHAWCSECERHTKRARRQGWCPAAVICTDRPSRSVTVTVVPAPRGFNPCRLNSSITVSVL